MSDQPIQPIQAPAVGRPRKGGQMSDATRKNHTLRDLTMNAALKEFEDQLDEWLETEPISPKEVLIFQNAWFRKYWGPMDKRRLIDALVTFVDEYFEDTIETPKPEY